jgi:hypothetical protein
MPCPVWVDGASPTHSGCLLLEAGNWPAAPRRAVRDVAEAGVVCSRDLNRECGSSVSKLVIDGAAHRRGKATEADYVQPGKHFREKFGSPGEAEASLSGLLGQKLVGPAPSACWRPVADPLMVFERHGRSSSWFRSLGRPHRSSGLWGTPMRSAW